jgi:hypothetical protein
VGVRVHSSAPCWKQKGFRLKPESPFSSEKPQIEVLWTHASCRRPPAMPLMLERPPLRARDLTIGIDRYHQRGLTLMADANRLQGYLALRRLSGTCTVFMACDENAYQKWQYETCPDRVAIDDAERSILDLYSDCASQPNPARPTLCTRVSPCGGCRRFIRLCLNPDPIDW